MSLFAVTPSTIRRCFPRVSGAEPDVPADTLMVVSFSPREWG